MYLNDLVVTCDDGNGNIRTATVDPSAGPGNITATESDNSRPVLFGAAVNRGDGNQQGTAYWNVLLGMSLNGNANEVCTLTTSGTASDVALTAGATPEHTRYPIVQWDVELSNGTDRTCSRHPLNGGNGVATTYTTISAATNFGYQMARLDGGHATATVAPAACPCWTLESLAALHGSDPLLTYSFDDTAVCEVDHGPFGNGAYYYADALPVGHQFNSYSVAIDLCKWNPDGADGNYTQYIGADIQNVWFGSVILPTLTHEQAQTCVDMLRQTFSLR